MLRKLLWVFSPLVLFAQPTCPEVVHGTASFSSSDQRMEIVSGDKTIIHWQSFSIDPSESVIFNQLDSKFSVLNRVLSSDASKLLGTIQSNGNVLLINPNGVLIGKTARIDTNGFFGSTLDVLDSDFLNGKDLKFSGSSINSIVNLGTIQSHGGDITLIGRFVTNEGTLDAGIGSVTLAVGSEILIKPSGESKVFISASESSPSSTGLSNSGNIDALKVRLLADGNPYELAIKQEGKINATNLTEHNGEIYLLAEGGTVENSGLLSAPGGNIHIHGKTVGILDEALLDVSSSSTGGEILIGGSLHGKDESFYNSQFTYIGKDTAILANSLENGNGGKVILWSDGASAFYGNIEAKEGASSGNGGFVEVSGKNFLAMRGLVNRMAPNGKPGTLLLDPSDVIISAATTANMTYPGASIAPTALAGCVLNTSDLTTQLNLGPVTVTTASAFGGNGDMTISGPIDSTIATPYNTSNLLTLDVDRNLTVSDNVQNDGTGGITCNVGGDFIVDGTTTNARLGSRGGNINITAGGDARVQGGAGGIAQVGYLSTVAPPNAQVISNITMNITGQLEVGSAGSQMSMIGHQYLGTFYPPPSLAIYNIFGNINITTGTDMTLIGGSGAGTGLAQIGHDVQYSRGRIDLDVNNDLILTANTEQARIGSYFSVDTSPTPNYNTIDQDITAFVTRDVTLTSGNAQAHIGCDGNIVFSDILVSVGRDMSLNSTNSFTLIGHTYTNVIPNIPPPPSFDPGINLRGDIAIAQFVPFAGTGGSLTLTGGTGGGSFTAFSQIGHSPHQYNGGADSVPTFCLGNTTIQSIQGDLTLTGGTGRDAYALIGDGGLPRDFSDEYQAPFGIVASTDNGNITITGGSGSAGSFAGIGFGEDYFSDSAGQHTFDVNNLIALTGNGNLTLQAGGGASTGNNHAFIGGYIDSNSTTPINTLVTLGTISTSCTGAGNILGENIGGNTVSNNAIIGLLTENTTNTSASCSTYLNVGDTLNVIAGSAASGAPSKAGVNNGTVACFPCNQFVSVGVTNGDATLLGSPTLSGADAFIYSNGHLTFAAYNGSIFMISQTGVAQLDAVLNSSVTAGVDINMIGNLVPPFFLTNASILARTDIYVTAGNDVNMIENSRIRTINGLIEVVAGNDMNMISPVGTGNFPFIRNVQGNDINIVVDNNFPTYPTFGPGSFNMDPNSQIVNAGGEGIRIFTSQQSLNSIQGLINGATFTPGPLYADISPEKWSTYFYDSFFHSGAPFTIFYKDGPLFIQNIQRSQTVVSEMLADELHPMDEFLGWPMHFQVDHDVGAYEAQELNGTSSYQAMPEQRFYFRVPKEFTHPLRLKNLILFYPPRLESKRDRLL